MAHDRGARRSQHRESRLTIAWRMIFSDLPSPAEAGFAKAGNRFPLFGIMRYRVGTGLAPR